MCFCKTKIKGYFSRNLISQGLVFYVHFSLHGINFASLHYLKTLKLIKQNLKKTDSVPFIVTDIGTFSETGLSNDKQKTRNNLTSTHTIIIKL